jgi:signal transduction histidine kinase/ActR/RegA family two-component response regulator
LERVHPDDRQHIRREVESDTYQIEHRVVRPDGEVRIVEERGQITRWDGGEPAEMTGTVLDVTERARLERQLRQAQKMEMVGTLAGGVAHDFNNILHAVGAYVHLAQDSLPDGAAEQAFLSRVDRGLERARKLVDQLMTFSRQEGPADKTAVSIADEVREVVDLVRPTLPSDTDLRVKLDEGPPVWGDPDQLQQVVMNLLTNAAHALGEMDAQARRVLDVKVCPIVVDEELAARHVNLTPGTYVRTTVSDTGGGIDAATQERIFDPFFTTKGVGEGTGLGLSVVHGIVRRHGGSVTVYSEPGEGTTFHVYVPAMEEEASAELAPPAPEPEALSVEGVRLLVVDDNPDIVDVEAERLRHMGCRVTPCLGPDAALEELRRAPDAFDAVLTDYTMPHMNGLELIAALRKMRPGLPALLFSGFSAQVDAADLRAAGVDAFLHKPVPQKDLRQALHALVTPQADRLAD